MALNRILGFIAILLCSILFAEDLCLATSTSKPAPAFQQCGYPAPGQLGVGVRSGPPFVYEEKNIVSGELELKGIAIEMWEEIATRLDLDYQYVCLGLDDTLNALETGGIDLAISPLTITKAREQSFDFSHQYFSSGLVFASGPSESRFDFQRAFNTLSNVFQAKHAMYLAIVFGGLFLMLALLAVKNLEDYQSMPVIRERSKPAQVVHIIFYSILNISGLRKDVFGFSSIGMQAFSFLILIVGVTVSASLFSMVTAALAQSITTSDELSANNLHQYDVSTLQGSTAETFICESTRRPSELTLTDTWESALNNVVNNPNAVVLGDWVQLVYLAQSSDFKSQISVQDRSFQFEPYGWGFRNNQPDKDAINQELIGMLRDNSSNEIIESYIGTEKLSL